MPFMNFQYDGSHMQVPTETGPEHNDSSGFSESCPVVARASPAGIRYIGELRVWLPVVGKEQMVCGG